MKLLIFSDPHIHPWNYGSTVHSDGWNSRLRAQQRVLNDEMVSYVSRNDIDYVICCGDVFHTHGKIDAHALRIATSLFGQLASAVSKQVFVIHGNHDLASNGVSSLSWLNNLALGKIEYFDTLSSYLIAPKMIFFFLPYTKNKESVKNFLDSVRKDEGKVAVKKYVFMHQGVAGVKLGSGFELPNEVLTPEMIPDNVEMAFTGHYHRHRVVSDNLIIVGSPMQHTWADTGDERGWVVYDTDAKEAKFVPSGAPEFVTIDMCGTSRVPPGSTVLDNKYNSIINDSYIRIKNWYGDMEELKVILMNKEHGAASVEFIIDKSTAVTDNIRTDNFDVRDLLGKYTEKNKITGRKKEIAHQLTGREYETPKSRSR